MGAEKEMKCPNSKSRMTVFPKIVIRSAFQNKMAIQDASRRMKRQEIEANRFYCLVKVPGSTG